MSDQNQPQNASHPAHNPGPVPPQGAPQDPGHAVNAAATSGVGVTLDAAKVKAALTTVVSIATPLSRFLPEPYKGYAAAVLPYLESDMVVNAIVMVAALPDHIKVQATQAAVAAAVSAVEGHAKSYAPQP